MSQPPTEPNAFTITNPARISLDFENTRVGMDKKSFSVKEGTIAWSKDGNTIITGSKDETARVWKVA